MTETISTYPGPGGSEPTHKRCECGHGHSGSRFDPDIPCLIEGEVTCVTLTETQPFCYGLGNRVVDPNKPFDVTVEWELWGQLIPLWLAALGGDWIVSVYTESMGGGAEKLIGTKKVPVASFTACPVPATRPNCRKYTAMVTVPAGQLAEGNPGSDISGVYNLVATVFLDSKLAGTPGFDLIGFRVGPYIQVESLA